MHLVRAEYLRRACPQRLITPVKLTSTTVTFRFQQEQRAALIPSLDFRNTNFELAQPR